MSILYSVAIIVLVILVLNELKATFIKKNQINKRLISMLMMYTVLTIIMLLRMGSNEASFVINNYSSCIVIIFILIISYSELIFIRSYFAEKSGKRMLNLKINLFLVTCTVLAVGLTFNEIRGINDISQWLVVISVAYNWSSIIMVTFKNSINREKKINLIILCTFVISTIKLVDKNIEATYWTYYLLITSHLLLSVFLGINNIIYKDALTNIYNRTLFTRKINEKLKRDKNFLIISIDLDDFKLINDRYGHSTGDQALMMFAAVLRMVCKNGMYAVRIGGDEFIIFGKVLDEYNIRNIMKELDDKISILNSKVGIMYKIKYSYGYDYYYNYDSFSELMEGIDKKMYKNKYKNKNTTKVN